MKTLDEVKLGITRYINNELLPKIPNEARESVGVRGALAYLQLRGDVILKKLLSGKLVQASEIFTDNAVDVDFLRDWLKAAIPPDGYPVSLPVNPLKGETLELVFKPTEVDLIYDYITGVR